MYNFQKQQSKDIYDYDVEDEEEGEEPLWAAKSTKTKGVGLGLGKGKAFSSGIGFSQTSQQQAKEFEKKEMGYSTGTSFYKGQSSQKDPYSSYGQTSSSFYTKDSSKNNNDLNQNDGEKSKQENTKKQKVKNPSTKDIIPKRFGLRYDPPTIILEYLMPSSGKLYHHKMKLMKLKADSDPQEALDYLKKKDYTYFASGAIPDDQIIDLVEKLKKKFQQNTKNTSINNNKGKAENTKENNQSISNINKKIEITKNLANPTTSTSSSLTKANSNDNNKSSSISNNVKNQPVSSTSQAQNFQKNNQNKTSNSSQQEGTDTKKQQAQVQQNSIQQKKQEQVFDEIEDLDDSKENEYNQGEEEEEEEQNQDEEEEEQQQAEDDEEFDYDNFNLNKLQTEELKKHKDKMEIQFKKNFIKPGDPGYEYDKQQDFEPTESNEWDMDMDDDADIV